MNFNPTLPARDPGQMLQAVFNAPERAQNCYQIAQQNTLDIPEHIQQILVCGMGGSGSCGDMLQALCHQSQIPILVNKSAELPHWVSSKTLVIAVSYSGNTREVLACVAQALTKGSLILALGSGGTLLELAQSKRFANIRIPGGLLPRAALFDMLFAVLGCLGHNPILSCQALELSESLLRLKAWRQDWYSEDLTKQSKNLPFGLAQGMLNWQQTLLWGRSQQSDLVALRWKNQLSENAKILASVSILPELNHNEVVAMCAEHHSQSGLLYFTLDARISESEGSHSISSDAIVLDLVKDYLGASYSVHAEGANYIEKILYLVYLGDFVSVYLAFLKGIDPSPIAAIDELKRRMFA